MLRRQVEQSETAIRTSRAECSFLQQQLVTQKVEVEGDKRLIQMQLKASQEALNQTASTLKVEQSRTAQLSEHLHTLELDKVSLAQRLKDLNHFR